MWLLLCLILLPDQNDTEKRVQKHANELAKQFYTAYENGQVDRMLPLASVPWYHDGKLVVQQQDVLKQELQKWVESRNTSYSVRLIEVKLVATMAAMKSRMPAKDRSMLEQVAHDDDYLVLVMLKPTDATIKVTENVVLLMRIRDGKPQAIGVKHTP